MNKTPKKILAIVVAAVSVVSIGAISSFAAGSGYESKKNFSDTNQDGICDYVGEDCHYLDTDNNGICDNYGTCQNNSISQANHCKNYVDADNNGICDNQSHAYNAGQRNRARCRGNR